MPDTRTRRGVRGITTIALTAMVAWAQAVTATDTTSATPPALPTATPSLCAAAARTDCRTSGTSKLIITDHDADGRDQVVFEWAGGTISPSDLGRPDVETDYALCAYDTMRALLVHATAPAGSTCHRRPCWKRSARGFRYGERRPYEPDGVKKVLLSSSADPTRGKLKFVLQGEQINGPGSQLPLLPMGSAGIIAQVVNGLGTCWETGFSGAEIRTNDRDTFKAVRR